MKTLAIGAFALAAFMFSTIPSSFAAGAKAGTENCCNDDDKKKCDKDKKSCCKDKSKKECSKEKKDGNKTESK